MRIRIGGELGGILMVVFTGLIITAIVAGILEFIKDNLLANKKGAQNVISKLVILVWIVGIVIVVLDLTDVFPVIRNLLFAVLK